MNSIRTPKEGTTVLSKRIAKAVDCEQWQTFRLAMKGMSTFTKLVMLDTWYEANVHENHITYEKFTGEDCDICIQIDNYLKCLSRGGFLEPGVNLANALSKRMRNLKILK